MQRRVGQALVEHDGEAARDVGGMVEAFEAIGDALVEVRRGVATHGSCGARGDGSSLGGPWMARTR